MGRVLTNNVTLAYAIEDPNNFGNLPAQPEWFILEPNSINTFGSTITTVSRNPISQNRQRRKGTITDLDSAVEWEGDLTLSHFNDFVEGFVFSVAVNRDLDITPSAVAAAADTYTVPALNAAQAAKLQFVATDHASLIYARGFVNGANNGIHQVAVAAANTDTTITVLDGLANETPPANAEIALCGHRSLDGVTDIAWAWNGATNEATLTTTGTSNYTTIGLTPGQFVHIGSFTETGGTVTIVNAMENIAANDMFGYARVKTIAAQSIVFDKVDAALQFNVSAVSSLFDILFGKFVRNVPTSNAVEFLERSFNFELTYPNLNNPSGDRYAYAQGNFCNTMALNLPLTDKATITFGFVGTDTQPPTATRQTNAASAISPNQTGAFNTTSDCVRLRITDLDENAVTTDFKSLTITFNNNVSPEKVLCNLGARFMNYGNFDVDIEAQLLFTDATVAEAVRANQTLTMDFGVKNDDGAILFDVPALTLGGGDPEFPVNETVLINTTSMAFQDPILNTSIGVSIFPVVPNIETQL